MKVPVDNRTSFVGLKSPPSINLSMIDYCIGVMNVGRHVFPIVKGDVIEGHAIFAHTKKESIERAKFSAF